MNAHRSSPIRFVGGKALFSLLVIVLAILSRPTPVAAQCATCGLDYQEDPHEPYPVIECIDFFVGADNCIMGPGWCFTFGDPCEWIMHLDFADDGRAYVLRESAVPADGELPSESGTTAVSETCDGVLLGLVATAEDGAFRSEPIILEL